MGAAEGANLPALLCDVCVQTLPVDGAGISLMGDAGVQLKVTATDERAQRLEELQLTLGEGPCVDAFTMGKPVSHPDIGVTGAGRWPAFAHAATEAGIAAVFAFPLQLGAIRLGVLDLYRAVSGPLPDAEIGEALAFGDAAMILLLHMQQQAPAGRMPTQLGAAWLGQTEVHQATGMVSVQAQVALADALVMLRARAFGDGRAVGDVAADVVARRLRFAPGQIAGR